MGDLVVSSQRSVRLPLALLLGFGWGLAVGCVGCPPVGDDPFSCAEPRVECDGRCVDRSRDRANCGECGSACLSTATCSDGQCVPCPAPSAVCVNTCADLGSSLTHCGACGSACANGLCDAGACTCAPPASLCLGGCFDLSQSSRHCGRCGARCGPSQECHDGGCVTVCAGALTACGALCVDTARDRANCGGCGSACGVAEGCDGGQCVVVPDLDGDGYTSVTGDCCETTAQCPAPARINPGAIEIVGNAVDEDCDGRLNNASRRDGGVCDANLPVVPADAIDYARALDVCDGLISAEVLRANGEPFASPPHGIGIHASVGANLAWAGARLLVMGSGLANLPLGIGPGSSNLVDDLAGCNAPACVRDWLEASNPPLKQAGHLPTAPACQSGTSSTLAHDSVMLRLKLRAPAGAHSFSFAARFFSAEYPEYVCSPFNDQLVVLVDGAASNTPDHNLMTFTWQGEAWPVGINVAAGTPLFQACDTQAANPACWDHDVSADSCTEGTAALAGTYFDRPGPLPSCVVGGATASLLTSGNVSPGQEFVLRIAIWDVGDSALDSFVLLDDFQWGDRVVRPGTGGVRRDGGSID